MDHISRRLLQTENIHKSEYSALKDQLLKELETKINPSTLERIKALYFPPESIPHILIVGDNPIMTDYVGFYLYCTLGYGQLFYESCYGKSHEDIKSVFDQWLDLWEECYVDNRYKLGITIFLSNFTTLGVNRNLRLLLDLFVSACSAFTRSTNNYSSGMFIVSTNNAENITERLLKIFEIIKLEPEKQIKTKDTPQTTPASASETMSNWSTDNDKQEVYFNGKLIVELSNKPFKLFCCLYKKRGKFVYNKTLMNAGCYTLKDYDKSFVDMMIKLENTLKKGLAIEGKVLEKKRGNKRRNIAYKLIT